MAEADKSTFGLLSTTVVWLAAQNYHGYGGDAPWMGWVVVGWQFSNDESKFDTIRRAVAKLWASASAAWGGWIYFIMGYQVGFDSVATKATRPTQKWEFALQKWGGSSLKYASRAKKQ
jgi:hypothetical protein